MDNVDDVIRRERVPDDVGGMNESEYLKHVTLKLRTSIHS